MRHVTKIIAFSALLASGTAHAAPPVWKVSESSGVVNILRSGVSKIAISGGQLRAGDVITTGKKSRAVLTRGQEYVVISPNSRLRISAPKKTGGVIQFFKELGNTVFKIDKKATPHFGVQTPYLAAVVKGTTFSVTVTESGSAVQVTEGAVQVSTVDGGATQLLSPGMIGTVGAGDQFKLSISGAEARSIISSKAPAKRSKPVRKAAQKPAKAAAKQAPVQLASQSIVKSPGSAVISKPVVATPVSLNEVTGGLVNNGRSGGDRSARPNRRPNRPAGNRARLPINLNLSENGNGNNPLRIDVQGSSSEQNNIVTDIVEDSVGNPAENGNIVMDIIEDSSGTQNENNNIVPDIIGDDNDRNAGNGNGNNGNGLGNGGPADDNDDDEGPNAGNGNGNNGNGLGNGGPAADDNDDEGRNVGNGNGNNGNGLSMMMMIAASKQAMTGTSAASA